jgi:trimethylamine---corrinoid protein Co-methyltransferase
VDSKLCDAQAGYESLLSALIPSLAGANLIYGTGMLDSGMVLDYGKMILDDEINLAIKHLVKGMPVNQETLSVGSIKEIGQKGNFLTHPSTLSNFTKLLRPDIMNRENYERWSSSGKSSAHDRALEKARNLVANHHPASISSSAQKEIDEIIRETEKELKVGQ